MIRAAEPRDVPTILALIRELAEYERAAHEVEATEEQLHAALFGPDPRAHAHVAVLDPPDGRDRPDPPDGRDRPDPPDGRDGEVVGFALWFLNFSTWRGVHGLYLEDLYVRPRHRGGGHGKALLRTLAQVCVVRGYARLEWWVLDWNAAAQGFYRSIGARPMDEWTVWRLDGDALRALGAPAGG